MLFLAGCVEPDCTLAMESRDFIDILQARKTWISAYLEGKIDIEGDMVTVLKIRKIFGKYAGLTNSIMNRGIAMSNSSIGTGDVNVEITYCVE